MNLQLPFCTNIAIIATFSTKPETSLHDIHHILHLEKPLPCAWAGYPHGVRGRRRLAPRRLHPGRCALRLATRAHHRADQPLQIPVLPLQCALHPRQRQKPDRRLRGKKPRLSLGVPHHVLPLLHHQHRRGRSAHRSHHQNLHTGTSSLKQRPFGAGGRFLRANFADGALQGARPPLQNHRHQPEHHHHRRGRHRRQ